MSDRTDRLKENLAHLDDEGKNFILEKAEEIKAEREANGNTGADTTGADTATPPQTPLE